MADHSTESRITLHPYPKRVRILVGDTLIADSCNAIELRERGYPHRQYLPRADVGKCSALPPVSFFKYSGF